MEGDIELQRKIIREGSIQEIRDYPIGQMFPGTISNILDRIFKEIQELKAEV